MIFFGHTPDGFTTLAWSMLLWRPLYWYAERKFRLT